MSSPPGVPEQSSTPHVPPPGEEHASAESSRVWEMELLVSGAVVFALLRVPGSLDRWMTGVEIHFAERPWILLFFAYYYLKLIVYTLIATFTLSLVVRGYWVGLVGLRSVFPEGVRWDRVKAGPVSTHIARRTPTLAQLTRGADRLGRLLFSSAFVIILIFGTSIILMSTLGGVIWALSRFVVPTWKLNTVLWTVLGAVLAPVYLAILLDKALERRYGDGLRDRPLGRVLERILRVYQTVLFARLYGRIQLTLLTNFRRGAGYVVGALLLLGLMGFFMVNLLVDRGRITADSYLYYPARPGSLSVHYRHYESLRPPGPIAVTNRVPTIQSDVIEGPYVRLFLPYLPGRHNGVLAEVCEDVTPLKDEGLLFLSRRRQRPDPGQLSKAIDCLARLHRISLDDELLEPELEFYTDASTGVRGLVTYLPTAELAPGRHVLRIEGAQDADDVAEGRNKPEYFIPFRI